MEKLFSTCAAFAVALVLPVTYTVHVVPPQSVEIAYAAPTTDQLPAEIFEADTAVVEALPLPRTLPITLHIPSIKLDAPVEHVSTDDSGEMGVPDGKTENVGWYQNGTSPGERGSAVMDAHVYAAFKNLHRVREGDATIVKMSDGSTRHFRVERTQLYLLEDVPSEELFNRSDAERLNFITCAGNWDARRETYDHRLVVYAVLAN